MKKKKKNINISYINFSFSSYACAISDGSEVVLTGGFGNRKEVILYNLNGFVADLPRLKTGRQYHACSSYVSGTQTVKNDFCLENLILLLLF